MNGTSLRQLSLYLLLIVMLSKTLGHKSAWAARNPKECIAFCSPMSRAFIVRKSILSTTKIRHPEVRERASVFFSLRVGPKDLVLGYAGLDRFHSCWTRTGWSRHLCVKDVMRLNTFMPAAIAVEEMFPYSFTAIPKVF